MQIEMEERVEGEIGKFRYIWKKIKYKKKEKGVLKRKRCMKETKGGRNKGPEISLNAWTTLYPFLWDFSLAAHLFNKSKQMNLVLRVVFKKFFGLRMI